MFHAALDDEDLSRFVLLLEDLAPAEQGDQLVGCTPGGRGRRRCASWSGCTRRGGATRRSPSIEWLRGDRETGIAMMSMLLPTLWAGFTERYDADLGADVRDRGRRRCSSTSSRT